MQTVFRSNSKKRLVYISLMICTTLLVASVLLPVRMAAAEQKNRNFAGLEIVLVVDTTRSMGEWFTPIAKGVADFINKAGTNITADSLRVGLLFYQDRKIGDECQLDYLATWRVQLTEQAGAETIAKTLAALSRESEANCGSDEHEEAVYDALNRAILDPKWSDGSFRVVMLIGDAPPHLPSNEIKNPLRLDQSLIQKYAAEKNVRFISLMIMSDPGQDVSSFRDLALARSDRLVGRFAAVATQASEVRSSVGKTLIDEWRQIIAPARRLQELGVTKQNIISNALDRK